jgi:multiple antibiotic resistance protein
LVNLIIVLLVFAYSGFVIRILGRSGSKAVAKIASLLLAAIAVMMIRVGLMEAIGKLN